MKEIIGKADLSHVKELLGNGLNFRDDVTGKRYFTGYSYKTLYDWDQYFEGIIQLYADGDVELVKNGVTIFLDNQADDGFIYRSVPRAQGGQGDEHVKPFLVQIALLLRKDDPSLSFITDEYYARLKKYLLYWLINKSVDGLAVWDSAPHTGMDNQHERCGYWYDSFCGGVDINSYLVRECRAMAVLSRIRGKEEDTQLFTDYAMTRTKAVQSLWDENDGYFYDRNVLTGQPVKVKSISSYSALWAKTADAHQAQKMVSLLKNPKEFYRPFPFPAYAATEPGYTEGYLPNDLGCGWRANTWIPTNYYTCHGLCYYGYTDFAREIAVKTYDIVKKVGDREYYNTDSATGRGLNPFWGWSLLAYFLPGELENEADPTEIKEY